MAEQSPQTNKRVSKPKKIFSPQPTAVRTKKKNSQAAAAALVEPTVTFRSQHSSKRAPQDTNQQVNELIPSKRTPHQDSQSHHHAANAGHHSGKRSHSSKRAHQDSQQVNELAPHQQDNQSHHHAANGHQKSAPSQSPAKSSCRRELLPPTHYELDIDYSTSEDEDDDHAEDPIPLSSSSEDDSEDEEGKEENPQQEKSGAKASLLDRHKVDQVNRGALVPHASKGMSREQMEWKLRSALQQIKELKHTRPLHPEAGAELSGDPAFFETFPVRSSEALNELEAKLKVDTRLRKYVIDELLLVGGDSWKESVYLGMKFLLTPAVGVLFTFTGVQKKNSSKLPFKFLAVARLLKEAVQKKYKTNPPSNIEVARRMGRWLTECKTKKMTTVHLSQDLLNDDFFN